MMKVCIIGAGAVGGVIGARLAAARNCALTAVARGATLAALRAHGWRLRLGEETIAGPATASDRPADFGPQDLVIVAVKAQAMAEVARGIAPLLGPETAVLPAMNGVPWWFLDGPPLDSVDRGGAIAAAIPFRHVVGCVVHAAASVAEPGLAVQHIARTLLIIGEPDGRPTARVARLRELLASAGIAIEASSAIRRDIWHKLWGNLVMNPVSALTGATADKILDDALLRAFCSAAMREAAAIGAKIGCAIEQGPEERHAITRKLGAFKTSMLQDVEANRPIELDAIVTAVHEIGRRVGVATPTIDGILGLARVFAEVRGLYSPA
jgi:2-dehydropantoate 2-reductase